MKSTLVTNEAIHRLLAPMGAALAGSLVAMLLLLGIMGGYILGTLIIALTLITVPIAGVVACARWLLRVWATGAPEEIPELAGAVPIQTEARQTEARQTEARQTEARQTATWTQALQSVDLFKGLSDQELAEIAGIGRAVNLLPGALMARQNDEATSVYVILEGQVQLTTASPQGEMTVRIAGPGESLPLAALIGSGRLITTAYAMTQIRGLEIPRSKFGELMLKQPQIGLRVYQNVANILGTRYQTTLTRLVGTMEQSSRAEIFATV